MPESILLFKYYWAQMVIIAVLSYFIGCINSSILVTKIMRPGKDIREMGSGSAGFTNAMRTMGKRIGILTFAGDFTKGVMAVWLGRSIIFMQPELAGNMAALQYGAYLAGIMCVLGHIWPCFFKFKGGKGILTTWAVTFLIDWRAFLILIFVFLIVLFFSKMVSLASICAAVMYPITTFLITYFIDYKYSKDLPYVVFSSVVTLLIAIIIIYKHRSNITRILNGTESTIMSIIRNK